MITYKVADLMEEMKAGGKFGAGSSTTNLVKSITQVGKFYLVKGENFEIQGDENLMVSVTPIEYKGTTICIYCEAEFTKENPCCCDGGIFEDGSHSDGVCVNCCAPNHKRIRLFE